jgi:hypothetical protein
MLVPFACSLRITDPAVSLGAVEDGLARMVADGSLHGATIRFDHVSLTLDAASRDDAMRAAREILDQLGARRVQVFAALPVERG